MPSPLPEAAPPIIPGISSIWILAPSWYIIPGTTVRVVNWYDPTLDFAFVSLFSRVDFPTLGSPIRTTVPFPVLLTSKPPKELPADITFP